MKISVIGSGQIGSTIAHILSQDPETEAIALIDHNGNTLSDAMSKLNSKKIKSHKIEIDHYEDLAAIISPTDCVISALPPHLNRKITGIALRLGKNYVDLGGSDLTLEQQLAMNNAAIEQKCWIVPYCGFAPGLMNIVAMQAVNEFDSIDDLTIYGGSLPTQPEPPFYFQMNFTPMGLVKEYVEPALVIKDGELTTVDALSNIEDFTFKYDGSDHEMEAFIVSGRISSLAKQLEGKVKNLAYKAIRFKGHKNILDVLLALGFMNDSLIDVRSNLTYQDLLIKQLTKHLPKGKPDFVLGMIRAIGQKSGKKKQLDYTFTEFFNNVDEFSALSHVSAISTIVIAKILVKRQNIGIGGASAPEGIIPYESYISGLEKYGLSITKKES